MLSRGAVLRLSRARQYSRGSVETIGFIGLGNMGGHMAANLLKASHPMVVFDVMEENTKRLADAGATVAYSPKEVAAKSDVVITMLPSTPHVMQVYQGKDGIFEGASEGLLCIDASTINPTVAGEVAAAAATHSLSMIDAPVSGGTMGAENATLSFMVGGSKESFARANPILSRMGANIVHCGDPGTGQIAKVCNNMVLGISMAGVAEAMNLGTKLGIEPEVLAGIFNTSSARCWSSDTYNPCPGVMEGVPASRGYTGGFGADLMLKDLTLATEAATNIREPLTMGATAQNLYQLMSQAGYGHKDFSGIWLTLQKQPKKD